jgi:hypothetical protein
MQINKQSDRLKISLVMSWRDRGNRSSSRGEVNPLLLSKENCVKSPVTSVGEGPGQSSPRRRRPLSRDLTSQILAGRRPFSLIVGEYLSRG